MSMDTKPTAEDSINQTSPTGVPNVDRAMTANRKPGAAKQKVKSVARPRSSRPRAVKLVCRYCGSDDLAPSFKKRHDARCRACFKKRYRSNGYKKKATTRSSKRLAR